MDQISLDVDDRPMASITVYGGRAEPVEIEVRAECPTFVAKPCALCGKPKSSKVHTPKKTATCPFKRQNGCATCGRAKGHDAHFGAPPTFNAFAGTDPNAYRSQIATWKSILLDRLREALPEGAQFAAVMVEGEATFPKPARRDQGNHRVLIEKALGDALVDGGWLADDTWDRYEFGGLTQRVEMGVSAIRLILFPRA